MSFSASSRESFLSANPLALKAALFGFKKSRGSRPLKSWRNSPAVKGFLTKSRSSNSTLSSSRKKLLALRHVLQLDFHKNSAASVRLNPI